MDVAIVNCWVSSVCGTSLLSEKSLNSLSVLFPVSVEFDDSDGGQNVGVLVVYAP
jgi:hypothetical protein